MQRLFQPLRLGIGAGCSGATLGLCAVLLWQAGAQAAGSVAPADAAQPRAGVNPALPQGAAGAGLKVCIDSSSAAAARDQAVAEAVARRTRATLAVHHFDGAGDDEGFTAKAFRALLAGPCDLVLGYPVDNTGGDVPAGLRATRAYDETGFALVTAAPLPSDSLAGLPPNTEVAVTYGSVANLYFVSHRNITADIHMSEDETLKALTEGHVKAAMLWQPTIAAYLDAQAGSGGRVSGSGGAADKRTKLSFHPLAEPHARWNIVALYGPRGDAAAAQFQAGLPPLRKSEAGGDGYGGRFGRGGRAVWRTGSGWRAGFRWRFGRDGASGLVQLAAAEVNAGTQDGAVPALYTEAQAKAGAAKYSDDCAQCHGDKLQGQSGPALSGRLFASVKTGFSVGDILTFMSINMPATQPGSLSHDDYTQIMAYILAQNGFPAGPAALTFDGGSQSKVPLLYHGK